MQALRIIFFALAVVIGILIGWRATHLSGLRPQAAPVPAPAPLVLPQLGAMVGQRQSIEDRFAEAPEYAAFFARLKTSFPGDYDRILSDFATRAAATGQIASPDVYLAEALRDLRQTRGIAAAQAQSDALGRVFAVQAQILDQLATASPSLCVEFLYGEAGEDFYDFSQNNRQLIAQMAEAGLGAILDGQAQKIDRPAPTLDEFDLLEQQLTSRGLDSIEIGALLDGKMPDPPLPAERMCAAGRTYFDALQALPEETRLKMFALAVALMARS